MKITFVIPHTNVAGGVRVIFELANHLQMKGHEVCIVCPLSKSVKETAKMWFRNRFVFLFNKPDMKWFELKAKLKFVPSPLEKFMPDADIIVATVWYSAEWVNCYSRRKGKKFYYVQSYEAWAGPRERVDATYKLPLTKIVVSSHLKNLLEIKFKENVAEIAINGVNFSQFYNEKKVFNKQKRIGMVYSSTALKGSIDGILAFKMAKEKYPDIKLVMYGNSFPGAEVPDDVEYYFNPPQDQLRKIYSSCDIWLFPSWYEGFGLPPMEAMACKCAVISTNVGGIADFTIPNQTALISPPSNPVALTNNIIKLLGNEGMLHAISYAGYEFIQQFTWENTAKKIEKIFLASSCERKDKQNLTCRFFLY